MSNTHLDHPLQLDRASLDSSSRHHTQGIPVWEWFYMHVRQPCFGSLRRIVQFLHALRLCLHSGIWNMNILLARNQLGVDLGPHYERLPCGCLAPNNRTDARSDGIRELRLRYPVANTLQFQLFLEGFDKGEQFALDSLSKPTQGTNSSSTSHSERCILQAKSNITLDMLKRQWYKSQYESPRHPNPSQSD